MNFKMGFAVLGLLVLPSIAEAQRASRPPEQIDPSLVAKLSGKWATASDPKGCAAAAHRIRFSSDRRTLFIEHDKPIQFNGKPINLSEYHVLYADGASLTLYLEGEDRRNSLGDRVLWILSLSESGLYSWRRSDWAVTVRTEPRKRCGD